MIQIQPSEDNADLTGTVINASAPVAVFGGNKCAIVPGEMCCCDHLEEQLLPLNAWGEDAILARHAPRFGFDEVADQPVWRIVAGSDGMTVAFDPPVEEVGSSYHFTQAGEVLQFQSPGDHHVTGELDTPTIDGTTEAPFMAYQLMTGQCYLDNNQCHNVWGDPMMLLAPPAGQYLDRYVFNTDDKHDFRFEHVIVIRPQGATVEIECIGILNDDAFIQVGTSNFEVGRFTLEEDDIHVAGCVDGTQRLFSDQPVGLMVVGYDSGNSYGYLGGVGVRHINPVIVVK